MDEKAEKEISTTSLSPQIHTNTHKHLFLSLRGTLDFHIYSMEIYLNN